MMIMEQSAKLCKRSLQYSGLTDYAKLMVTRMVLAFILHTGRMSCSAAAGVIASQPTHRGQLTRFLARPRWQKFDFNTFGRQALLNLECSKGRFIFIIDATLISQTGKCTENVYNTGNRKRKRRSKKGRRYNKNKTRRKNVHSFTFGLLITPSGHRIPWQIPHYTKEYAKKKGKTHLTTAQAAAKMIRELPLEEGADVLVLGDTAYDAKCVREACEDRNYLWIFPANPERVYEGPTGDRPQLRSRLKNWAELSQKKIKLRASTGKYAPYRRISRYRVGLKQKPRVYYATQEKSEVRNVGCVQLVFSTMKPNLKKATPDNVKILMTNAAKMSLSEVIEAYSVRWQIELFFKELKSTLNVNQYQFKCFAAVEAWMNCAIATVLFLEQLRANRMKDRRLSDERKGWWERQRLHGLCAAFRQECMTKELKYLSERLKTPGGIKKLKRLLTNTLPPEFRGVV